ncbi:MAG: ATP-binding protein [Isosphaeraceae bacterium]
MRDNLPDLLTSFVGRKGEIRRVRARVVETRLLTLIGPGGCGKSRLALEAASACRPRFKDGVLLIELAPLAEPRHVLRTIADVLEVPDQPGRHLAAAVSEHLQPQEILILLDNCEHVIAEAASVIDSMLKVCPHLHVLATSRVPLGIQGERTWSVPQMTSSEAVALLAERAAEASSQPVIGDDNSALAYELCQRLDGMPLAIELAAARLKTLSLDQVASRLSDRFGLLTGGSRSALQRHRTLEAAMEWSYELLTASGRRLWCRAAVFAGGFELPAAEAVCSDGELDQAQILDCITELVDNSILQVQGSVSGRRFHMLETVRQYGLLKLDQSGERSTMQERQLRWFLDLARRAEPEWRGPNQRMWLDRLAADLDNVRAALEFSRGDEHLIDEGLQLASSLWLLWHQHHIGEGRQWLSRLLERARPDRARAYALNVGGFMAYVHGEPAAALPLLEESLRLNDQLGDRAGANFALLRLGIGLYYNNDLEPAIDVLSKALALYRESNDRVGIYVSAYELAEALTMRGDFVASRALHEESLALKELQGDAWHIAFSHFGLGLLAWREGDHRQAIAQLRESLTIREKLDEWWGGAKALEALGWVEVTVGHAARGLQLLGAAAAVHEGMGVVLSPNYQVLHDRCLEAAREQMTADALRMAWNRGHELSWSESIAYALRDGPLVTAKRKRADGVTGREQEIARLVATGMTNRQIARSLSIAERTVDAHVEHIMNKLGYRSRAQIAAWATAAGDPPRSREI